MYLLLSFIALFALPAAWTLSYLPELFPLFHRGPTCNWHISYVHFSTSTLRTILVILLLTLKQLLMSTHLLRSSLPRRITKSTPTHIPVPQDQLTMPFRVLPSDVSLYRQVLNIQAWTPPTTLLFLSTVTELAMVGLGAKWTTPIKLMGGVRARSRLELLVPAHVITPESLVNAKNAYIVTRWLPGAKIVKRGMEYGNETLLYVQLPGDKEATPVFRHTVAMLHFLPSSRDAQRPANVHEEFLADYPETETVKVQLKLSYASPTQWAYLSKDYNLLHLSKTVAKLYGFPGKMAHGSQVAHHGVGKMINEGGVFPEGMLGMGMDGDGDGGRVWMEVRYRRPTVVPAELEVRAAGSGGNGDGQGEEVAWEVLQRGKICVEGRVGVLKGELNSPQQWLSGLSD